MRDPFQAYVFWHPLGIVKKNWLFFSELCALWGWILQALRNGLHQTVFRNSTGNTLFRADFDFRPNVSHIMWLYMDQSWNKLEKACSQSNFQKQFGEIFFYGPLYFQLENFKLTVIIFSPPFPPAKVIDTLGAGDSFVGSTIHMLNKGESLERKRFCFDLQRGCW